MSATLFVSLALFAAAPTPPAITSVNGAPRAVAMPGGEFLWPQFRGPGGEGHVAQTGLPLEWSETKNIVWKTPIAGGWSSAVIQGDQVWVTSCVELPPLPVAEPAKPAEPKLDSPPKPAAPPKPIDPLMTAEERAKLEAKEKKEAEKEKEKAKPAPKPEVPDPPIELRAVCLDRTSGKIVHDVLIFKIDAPAKIHKKNNHASPTAVIDGDRIFLHFGAHGTACITTDGAIVWKNQTLKYNHRHGPGGSPVVYKDLLLLSCDGTDVQYVVGLDKKTGETRWKSTREGRMAYSTPLLIEIEGKVQLISTGGDAVIGYEPETGREIWRCKYNGYSLVPRPVVAHGFAYICTGYDTPSMFALKLGGTGDVTETHKAWTVKKGAPLNPSPIVVGDEIYMVSDKGIASALNAVTGDEVWQERIGGNFSASPLFAEGRIYLLDEEGKCTVVAPGKEFKELAKNQVDGRTLAGLSVAGKSLFLRTDTHLYRLEVKP
ncbi:MAG: PQQ-like beta-propeller repeat protein [Planctomycetia bacterium]|nr:PQQ-like beta-propeller repeat protein [Planctomycetia bacterium]